MPASRAQQDVADLFVELKKLDEVPDDKKDGQWAEQVTKATEAIGEKRKIADAETKRAQLLAQDGLDQARAGEAKDDTDREVKGPRHAEVQKVQVVSGPERKTIGQQFVESKSYKDMLDHPGAGLVASMETKTLISGGVQTVTATGVSPFIQHGQDTDVVRAYNRPLTLRDLVNVSPTTSNAIDYMVQGTFTNAAAPVAEGATKPEAALAWTLATAVVRTIAVVIPATRQALADFGQLQNLIDNDLTLMVQLSEEDQILNGDGTGQNFTGILTAAIGSRAQGADSSQDALFKAAMDAYTATFIFPDGIVTHPTDWTRTRLLREGAGSGQYLLGAPMSEVRPVLWGLPVVVTPVIAAGTGLVGNFRLGSTLWDREAITIATSDSHSTFFVENKVMVRVEERAAFGVKRPTAFTKVTGLS